MIERVFCERCSLYRYGIFISITIIGCAIIYNFPEAENTAAIITITILYIVQTYTHKIRPKAYIIGANNKDSYKEAEIKLKKIGYKPINKFNYKTKSDALSKLCHCKAVYVLKNTHHILHDTEMNIAKTLNMQILHEW